MKTHKKLAHLTPADIALIIGYSSLGVGVLLTLETLLSLGISQYPGGSSSSSGFPPSRYLVYAMESSFFLRYTFILALLGGVLILIGYLLRIYGKKKR
jgi:uncharacterized membrane protein YphA (DoxX/SURF4 family)